MTLYYYHWNIICFVATTLTFPYWPLPLAAQSLVVMFIIIVVSYRIPLLGWVRGFLLAFSLVSLHSHLFQMKVETVFHFGNDITINVRVDSFFKKISRGSEYLVSLESINEQNIPFFIRPNIKLVAPEGTNFRLGERWKLFVKVKPVFGRLNEAGFDQEKYYISQGWHAKAILKNVYAAELLEKSHSVRLKLYQTVDGHLDALPNKAMLLALSFGNRNEISNEQWQYLKESGLIHLIAISGLHIGIAYLIGWKVGNAIRLIFHNWYSAPLVFALLFAATYSWLAGFSIPTLRALIMCCMLGLFSHARIHLSVWQTLILTASGILIVDPFSLLSVSFSLTFLAVSCLYVLSSYKRFSQSGWLKKTIIMQLTLSVIMLPVTGYFFSGFSLSSSLYNFVFLPIFSFVIVPVLFIALLTTVILPNMASFFWNLSDKLLEPIYWAIQFSNDSWINIDRISLLQVFALVVVIFLKPLLKREQQIVVGLSVLFIIQTMTILPKSSWQVSVLDVGHGLAVLIRKGNQHILYDTGVKWETGSMAEMVIAPVLRNRGVDDVGLLILSHSDSDHAGGREYIEQHFTPSSKLSSQRISGYSPCVDKTMLHWNGLTLSAVWPPKLVKRAYNPHSCVIRVTDGVSSILLTGDIEAIGEILLAKKGDEIRSDILLVPHHGSRTSSTDNFLNAVDPKVAIASVARGNQWDLPSEKVVNKYMTRNIKWLDTGSDGQISIDFSRNGWQIMNIRNRHSLSWYRKILRKGVE